MIRTLQLSERNVRRAIVEWLFRNGYGRNLRERGTGDHGIDIQVRHNRYGRYFIIECKGDPVRRIKSLNSRREVCFLLALGQIASRMKVGAALYRYGIGFPETYREKVLRRLPWTFCKKTNLCVLLVSKAGKVGCVTWRELKRHQPRSSVAGGAVAP